MVDENSIANLLRINYSFYSKREVVDRKRCLIVVAVCERFPPVVCQAVQVSPIPKSRGTGEWIWGTVSTSHGEYMCFLGDFKKFRSIMRYSSTHPTLQLTALGRLARSVDGCPANPHRKHRAHGRSLIGYQSPTTSLSEHVRLRHNGTLIGNRGWLRPHHDGEFHPVVADLV